MNFGNPGKDGPSVTGLLACLVGSTMLVIQLGVLVAVALGVRDNQGYIYAFFIPLFTYLIGVPLGLLSALAGLALGGRNRSLASLGLILTLAGPALFVALIAVGSALR